MKEAQSSKLKAKNKNSKLKTNLSGFGFFVIILSFALLVFSFNSYAIEIDPLRVEYTLQAGKTYSGAFRIKNSSGYAVDISVSTDKYRYVFSEGMIPPEKDRGLLPSCQDWLQLSKTKLILKPGETAEAAFTIKVPRDAKEEHLCAVLFDEKLAAAEKNPKDKTPGAQLQIVPRFSVPVYISIKEGQKISARINNMEVLSETRIGGVKINISLENDGNTHLRPSGTLVIFNRNGEVAKNLPIGRSLPLFPGYKETIPVICPKLPAGKYSAVATIEIAPDNLIQEKTSFTLTKSGDIE